MMSTRLRQAQKKLERGFPLNAKDYEMLMYAQHGDTHTPEHMSPRTYKDLDRRIREYHANEERKYQARQNRKGDQ